MRVKPLFDGKHFIKLRVVPSKVHEAQTLQYKAVLCRNARKGGGQAKPSKHEMLALAKSSSSVRPLLAICITSYANRST